MKYIDFCGNKISQMGLGTSSFQSIENIRNIIFLALSNCGINYIDTAYSYGGGETLINIGTALGYYPRNKYFIASKASLVEGKFTEDELFRHLQHQSSRLKSGYLDYFMIHGLGYNIDNQLSKISTTYPKFEKSLDYVKKMGIAKHIGFSYDGTYDDLNKLLDMYDWDFVMIKNNIIDDYYKDITMQKHPIDAAIKYKKTHPNFGIMNMEIFEHGLLCSSKYAGNQEILSESFILDKFIKSNMPFICGVSNGNQLKKLIYLYNDLNKSSMDNDMVNYNINKILDFIKSSNYLCYRCHLCENNKAWPKFAEFVLAYNKYINNYQKETHLKSLLERTDLDMIDTDLDTNDYPCDINVKDFINELKRIKQTKFDL